MIHEDAVISILKEMDEKIVRTGIVDKQDCLATEEMLGIKIFSGPNIINYTTTPGTRAGVDEIRSQINKYLTQYSTSPKNDITYTDLLKEMHNLKNNLLKITDRLNPIVENKHKLSVFRLEKYALAYDNEKLINMVETSDILKIINNYDYISKVSDALNKNLDITLKSINDYINNIAELLSKTGSTSYNYPLLNNLVKISNHESVNERCSFLELMLQDIRNFYIDQISFSDVLSMLERADVVINFLNKVIDKLEEAMSINNPFLTDVNIQRLYKLVKDVNEIYGVENIPGDSDFDNIDIYIILIISRIIMY